MSARIDFRHARPVRGAQQTPRTTKNPSKAKRTAASHDCVDYDMDDCSGKESKAQACCCKACLGCSTDPLHNNQCSIRRNLVQKPGQRHLLESLHDLSRGLPPAIIYNTCFRCRHASAVSAVVSAERQGQSDPQCVLLHTHHKKHLSVRSYQMLRGICQKGEFLSHGPDGLITLTSRDSSRYISSYSTNSRSCKLICSTELLRLQH